MSEPEIVVLEATGVRYFSRFDEAAFFEWLDKLKCVSKYYGELRTLYIEVQVSAVDATQLDELLGLFFRYHVDTKQLAVLTERNLRSGFAIGKHTGMTQYSAQRPQRQHEEYKKVAFNMEATF